MRRSAYGYLSWVFAIGRMDAICQPFASRTNVWLTRNVLSWGGLPGKPCSSGAKAQDRFEKAFGSARAAKLRSDLKLLTSEGFENAF
jgi:hypothetical protein